MESRGNILLRVTKLEVVYHHVSIAVQGISFDVAEAELFVIIGRNGAGKTTVLRAISGFLGSDNAEIVDGRVEFRERVLNMLPPQQIARTAGIILVPEREKVFDTLTVEENLSVSISDRKWRREKDRIYEYFPLLHRIKRGSLGGFLSGGERQMVAIAQALLCSPKLLLVDELSLGLSPLVLRDLFAVLCKINKELALTILLVEQNAGAALSIADYAAVMENGRIVLDGLPETLSQNEDVREFYLGLKGEEQRNYSNVKRYSRTNKWRF